MTAQAQNTRNGDADVSASSEPFEDELYSRRRLWQKRFVILVVVASVLKTLRSFAQDPSPQLGYLLDAVAAFSVPMLVFSAILLIFACSGVPSVRRVALTAAIMCFAYYGLNLMERTPVLLEIPVLGRGDFLHSLLEDLMEVGAIAALLVSFYLGISEADRAQTRLARERRDLALEVAERKRAEVALRDSEERFRLIFNGIQEGIAFYSRNMKAAFFNRVSCEMLGYEAEEMLKQDARSLVHPDDWEKVSEFHRRRMAGEVVDRTYEMRLMHRDGRPIHVEASFDPIYRGEEIIGVQGIYRDITERKRAQEALRESEEHYRQLFEGISDVVYVIDADRRLVAANERAEQHLGYARDELLRLRYEDICGPDDARLCQPRIEHVMTNGEARWESVRRRRDGSTFAVDVSARRIQYHGLPAVMFISRDITERKRTEEALQALAQGVAPDQSGEIHHRLVENLAKALNVECAFVAVQDDPGKPAARTVAVYFEGRFIENFDYSLTGSASAMISGQSICLYPSGAREAFPGLPLLGSLNAESYVGAPLTSSSGKPLGIIGAVGKRPLGDPRNAESMIRIFAARAASELERQRTLEALRMSEERLRTLFEGIDDALFVYDEDGRILDCNAATCRRLDYTRQELLEMSMRNVDAPWFHEQFPARISQQLKQGRMACEGEHVTREGRRIPVDIHTSRISYQGRTAVLAVARDITERRRAEEERRQLESQMQHAQKLESLGVLAGGIAHEFNNLLMGVLGNASLALMELPEETPARESLRQIETAAQRAAELSKQMLAYSGKGRFVIQPLNLSQVVAEMAHLLEASVSKKAMLQYEFTPDLPLIEGDLSQVRQVIVNLVSNASESLSDRTGTVTVATGVKEVTRDYLKGMYLCENLPEGTYAFVEVRDTGCGMDPATLSKIFDPFFSTKFTGRGLGLAAVMGIVRGHKGALKVGSDKGVGSTFTVLLPCMKQVVPTETRPAPAGGSWQGSGTILLVDDEETVRAVTKRVLERAGFSVLSACDGVEGVEMFQANVDNIAAVLLDMTMPRMSGDDAFREMRRIRADIPIILSSGYNEPEALERFTSDGPSGFIQKPYRAEELMVKMRSVLDAYPAPSA